MGWLARLLGDEVRTHFEDRGHWLAVHGEANYQEALWALVGGQKGYRRNAGPPWSGTAALIPEPANEHDANAVRVMVNGKLVGYLTRSDAKVLHTPITRLSKHTNRPITVGCRMIGGFRLDETENGLKRAYLGIMLNVQTTHLVKEAKKAQQSS